MWVIRLADDSYEMSDLIVSERYVQFCEILSGVIMPMPVFN